MVFDGRIEEEEGLIKGTGLPLGAVSPVLSGDR